MAMTVQIDLETGSGPTDTAVTSCKWNRTDDGTTTTTPIPTPTSTGTNFSYVKTFVVEITATGSLTMTNILFGKVASETTTGTKLWYRSDHSSYTQATVSPAATSDNNTTAPVIPAGGNNTNVAAVPLISAPPSTYAAGPFSTTGKKGNFIETTCGVDATNTTAGTAVATPTLRWSWTEA